MASARVLICCSRNMSFRRSAFPGKFQEVGGRRSAVVSGRRSAYLRRRSDFPGNFRNRVFFRGVRFPKECLEICTGYLGQSTMVPGDPFARVRARVSHVSRVSRVCPGSPRCLFPLPPCVSRLPPVSFYRSGTCTKWTTVPCRGRMYRKSQQRTQSSSQRRSRLATVSARQGNHAVDLHLPQCCSEHHRKSAARWCSATL